MPLNKRERAEYAEEVTKKITGKGKYVREEEGEFLDKFVKLGKIHRYLDENQEWQKTHEVRFVGLAKWDDHFYHVFDGLYWSDDRFRSYTKAREEMQKHIGRLVYNGWTPIVVTVKPK